MLLPLMLQSVPSLLVAGEDVTQYHVNSLVAGADSPQIKGGLSRKPCQAPTPELCP